MPLSVNDMKIIIRLLENRLRSDFDPDCADLLSRMKARLQKSEETKVSLQSEVEASDER